LLPRSARQAVPVFGRILRAMKTALSFCLCWLVLLQAAAQQTPFERSGGTETTTYAACMDYYRALAGKHPTAKLLEYGGANGTDVGLPLHVLVIDSDRRFDAAQARRAGKVVLLINNNIHPGEPEGADASMQLARDLLTKPELQPLLARTVVCIIPMYNVDGALNRNSTSRASQNGPKEYGFRGNAKNLDLNRDFIKLDSRNAQTFTEIFHTWNPDVFVDNHTSNGADYQHIMTLLATQRSKLHSAVSRLMTETITPALYRGMEQKQFPMCPYVNTFGSTEAAVPDSGIAEFYDSPRYSSGYATLFHTLAYVPEAHMLKPFDQRVRATYAFMHTLLETLAQHGRAVLTARQNAFAQTATQKAFALRWKLNKTQYEMIPFRGYAAKTKASDVSGLPRLYYDRNEPWQRNIKFFTTYDADVTIAAPRAYVVPQAYHEVIDLLRRNRVQMQRLDKDLPATVHYYRIADYATVQRPFEGHYLHYNVNTATDTVQTMLKAGDYIIRLDQPAARYIVEVLEPTATDSYFAWNYFDGILMQKEYFSDYVFEDKAAELLRQNPKLKEALERKRQADPEFAKSAAKQLDFVYCNSVHLEPIYLRYPVGRLLQLPKGVE
jgi:hypothetical protein